MLKKIHTRASRERFRPPMSTAFCVQEPFRGVTEPRPTQNLVVQIPRHSSGRQRLWRKNGLGEALSVRSLGGSAPPGPCPA